MTANVNTWVLSAQRTTLNWQKHVPSLEIGDRGFDFSCETGHHAGSIFGRGRGHKGAFVVCKESFTAWILYMDRLPALETPSIPSPIPRAGGDCSELGNYFAELFMHGLLPLFPLVRGEKSKPSVSNCGSKGSMVTSSAFAGTSFPIRWATLHLSVQDYTWVMKV